MGQELGRSWCEVWEVWKLGRMDVRDWWRIVISKIFFFKKVCTSGDFSAKTCRKIYHKKTRSISTTGFFNLYSCV